MIQTFDEALEYLNIQDYKQQIFDSNSHGELFHLSQYIRIASFIEKLRENGTDFFDDKDWFRFWFEFVVKNYGENASRPATVYQYIDQYFHELLLEHISCLSNGLKMELVREGK